MNIPAFLSALLALVMTFMQAGKPAITPPHTQEEVVTRGHQVSDIAQDLNPQSQNPSGQQASPLPEDEDEDLPTLPIPIDDNGNTNNTPDTTKVATYNNRSEKDMPTTVPQVAVNNSPALDPSPPPPPPVVVEPEPNPEPTPIPEDLGKINRKPPAKDPCLNLDPRMMLPCVVTE